MKTFARWALAAMCVVGLSQTVHARRLRSNTLDFTVSERGMKASKKKSKWSKARLAAQKKKHRRLKRHASRKTRRRHRA